MNTYVIGVAGGSGSGKTTFAKKIVDQLPEGSVQILGQDNYYRDQSDKFDKDGGAVNFDHPDALELDLLAEQINTLKENKLIQVPLYDFASHSRQEKTLCVEPSKIIIVDGTLIFCNKKICEALDYLVFIDVDEDVRFSRRLKRDTEERGRTPEGVKTQFLSQVKPMHDQFVGPSKEAANRVVNDSEFNQGIKDIVQKCQQFL